MATNPKIDKNDPVEVERADRLLVAQLEEAHATEQALVTNLRAHIAMTPRGSYRESLERHLTETQQHERAVARRIREIGRDRGLLAAAYGALTTIIGQALVLTKGPLDLLREGSEGGTKLLENARDEVATEALEIAIYDSLEALAHAVGDDSTARLAARHRAQEERMLEQLRGHIPHLANAAVLARAGVHPSYDWETTGAAGRTAQRHDTTPRRPAAEQAEPPFPGYEDLTAREIAQRLRDGDVATAQRVRDYEGRHQRRVEVLEAASRQLSGSSS